MKTQKIGIVSKILTIIALAATTGFAQNFANEKKTENGVQKLEQTRGKYETKYKKSASFTSAANLANFNLGSDLTIAKFDAAQFETDENAKKRLIVDLVYLIETLENQPESAVLQNALKAIVKKSANAASVRIGIENASKSYVNSLAEEQKWFVESGAAITRLIFGAYIGDDAAIKKDLSEIEKLIKIAPRETPVEIKNTMNKLTKYVAQTAFSENEYIVIFDEAMSLFKAVNA